MQPLATSSDAVLLNKRGIKMLWMTSGRRQGLADIARHVIRCRFTQHTRVQRALGVKLAAGAGAGRTPGAASRTRKRLWRLTLYVSAVVEHKRRRHNVPSIEFTRGFQSSQFQLILSCSIRQTTGNDPVKVFKLSWKRNDWKALSPHPTKSCGSSDAEAAHAECTHMPGP